MAPPKLGELLIQARVLKEAQLQTALAEQKKWGGRLGDILVRMSLVKEDDVVRALSTRLGIPVAALDGIQAIPQAVRAKIPPAQARELYAIPLQLKDNAHTLVVAMSDPQDLRQLDTLRAITRCKVIPYIAGRTTLARAFARLYDMAADLSDQEGSFKVVDAQGRTLIKAAPRLPPPTRPAPAPKPVATPVAKPPAQRSEADQVLAQVEQMQRQEVATLKAMVELLIEKGVFTREEYVSKISR